MLLIRSIDVSNLLKEDDLKQKRSTSVTFASTEFHSRKAERVTSVVDPDIRDLILSKFEVLETINYLRKGE